jgi:hypothetical protein
MHNVDVLSMRTDQEEKLSTAGFLDFVHCLVFQTKHFRNCLWFCPRLERWGATYTIGPTSNGSN